MDAWLLLAAVVVGLNPARIAPALPRGDRLPPERAMVAALGAVLAAAALAVLAAGGDAFADWWDVSPPTIAVAAGLVLSLAAVARAIRGTPRAEPALPGRRAALVPVAVPFVLRPEVGLVALAGGAAGEAAAVVAGLLVGVVLTALGGWFALGATPTTPTDRVVGWLARLGEAAAVLAGIALVVDGIYSV